jgi:predicted Zn-dependent protease
LSPLDTSLWVAHGVLATAYLQLARYEESAHWARSSTRRHIYNAPAFHVLAASCAQLGLMDQAHEAIERALEFDPKLTIRRLEEIFLISRYRNLDRFLEGLRKAGLPE